MRALQNQKIKAHYPNKVVTISISIAEVTHYKIPNTELNFKWVMVKSKSLPYSDREITKKLGDQQNNL